jgi:hypothetical protein
MNQKIEITHVGNSAPEKEFASGFFLSLILLTIAVLIFVVIIENEGKGYHESRAFAPGTPLFTLFPAIFVSGNTIANGLQAFSGKALTPANLSIQIMTLTGILFTYIIIPTVFFFNWRRRRIEIKSVSTINPLSFSSVIYALSIILTISIAATAMISAIMSHQIHQSLEYAQAIQSDRDAIIYDLVFIALDAYQYKVLPKGLDGGQGKYLGFALAPERAKTQNGIYIATVNENQVSVKAQSLQFPSGVINATIDEEGQVRYCRFEGAFK